MLNNYLYSYFVLVVFFCVSLLVSILLLALTFLFSRKIKNIKKSMAYECWFNSYSSARIMFDIHFFIVGLLFLIFDLEIIFLYPWSITYLYLSYSSILFMYFFLFIIIIVYVY